MLFAASIVLARILTPNDYGQVAIVLSITGLATILTELGLSAAVVRAPEPTREYLSTAFWINAGSGVILAALVAVAAGPVAQLFSDPGIAPLLRVGSLSFALSLGVVQLGLLQRQMRFARIGIVEVVGTGAGVAVSLVLGVAGAGAMSLVIGPVAAFAVMSVMFWRGVAWRPSMVFDRAAARDIGGYIWGLVGFNTVNYWTRNADNFLVGGYVGVASLGLYRRAYNLMVLPVLHIGSPIQRVLLPAIASAAAPERKRIWLKGAKASWLLGLPIGVGTAAVATDVILVLYGSQWVDAAPVLQVLGLSVPSQMIGRTLGAALQATDRTRTQFWLGVVNTTVSVIAMVIGLQWGMLGVGVGVAISFYITGTIGIGVVMRVLDARWRELLREILPSAGVAVAMWLAVVLVGSILPAAMPVWLGLVAQAAVGGFTYVGGVAVVDRSAIDLIRRRALNV